MQTQKSILLKALARVTAAAEINNLNKELLQLRLQLLDTEKDTDEAVLLGGEVSELEIRIMLLEDRFAELYMCQTCSTTDETNN